MNSLLLWRNVPKLFKNSSRSSGLISALKSSEEPLSSANLLSKSSSVQFLMDFRFSVLALYLLTVLNWEIKSFPTLIEEYCDVKVLGLIRSFKGNSVQANTLITEILNGIDLEDVFRMKIPKLNGY